LSDFSFKKGERISSRRTISTLFTEGKAIPVHPFRILYQYRYSNVAKHPAAIAISVPKRLFGKAVDRNLLKRRTREAYRRSKPFFYTSLRKLGLHVNLVILYQHHQVLDYHSMHDALRQGLELLVQEIS